MDKGKYSLYQPDTTNLYIVKAVKNKITLKVFTVIKTYIIVWYYYILFSLLIFFYCDGSCRLLEKQWFINSAVRINTLLSGDKR